MRNLPTFDFETESDAIKRKQAIADAMQASALRPLELPTQPGVRLSGVNVLAKLLEGYVAGKTADSAKTERAALAKRYGDELRTGLEQYYKTSQGYEAPSFAMNPNEDGTPQMVKMAGDRKKAIFDALASNHPVLRELAMSQLKEEGKNQLTPKDMLSIATPESVLANMNNPGAWKPKRNLKSAAPGEILLDEAGNVATPGNPGGQASWQTTNIGGDLYQQSATGLKKLDNAPKITNNVNMPRAETAFAQAFGKAEGARLSEALGNLPQALDGQAAVKKGLKLLEQGIHTGITANIAKTLDKTNAVLFKADPQKAARTEEFISYIGDIVIPGLKAFGGSDTVEEMKYLQKVSGGEITMEATALAKVLQSIEQKIERKTRHVQESLKAAGIRYNLPTLSTPVPLPQAPSPALGGKPSVTNW